MFKKKFSRIFILCYIYENNMNENEEYTKDKPKPNKGTYYLIQCLGIEKFN